MSVFRGGKISPYLVVLYEAAGDLGEYLENGRTDPVAEKPLRENLDEQCRIAARKRAIERKAAMRAAKLLGRKTSKQGSTP